MNIKSKNVTIFPDMLVFLIVFGVILLIVVIIIVIVAYAKYVEENKVIFVEEHSNKLAEIKKINTLYRSHSFTKKRIINSIKLDSKKAFDNFDFESAIKNTFFDKRTEIKDAIDKVAKDKNEIRNYYSQVKSISSTCFEDLPKNKHVTKDYFLTLEESLASKEILKLETGLQVIVRWFYTSPAGRRSYSDSKSLSYDKTLEIFNSMFEKTVKKENYNHLVDDYLDKPKVKSDNNKTEPTHVNDLAGTVSKSLTKSLYKLSDVIEMYKSLGVIATKSLAEATLISSGYRKSKYPNFYIQSSISNVRDLILSSSNELGLITYENQIKDEEYDNAIAKLEKEGRIVPIDSLHFLKISKNLNYCGVTLDEIDEFESLLLKYSKKELFVSVKQVKNNIDCLVTRIEFDNCFVASIIKYCGFLSAVPGIEGLYTTIQKPQRIMFLEWLVKGKKSVDVFDLIYDLKELYGIEYNIYSIIYDLDKNKTKLYYNQEMEKLYSNKEYFFEELEDVL